MQYKHDSYYIFKYVWCNSKYLNHKSREWPGRPLMLIGRWESQQAFHKRNRKWPIIMHEHRSEQRISSQYVPTTYPARPLWAYAVKGALHSFQTEFPSVGDNWLKHHWCDRDEVRDANNGYGRGWIKPTVAGNGTWSYRHLKSLLWTTTAQGNVDCFTILKTLHHRGQFKQVFLCRVG